MERRLNKEDNNNNFEERVNNNLSLRKKKLDQVLSKHRKIKNNGTSQYEILLQEIKIDENIKKKIYQNIDEFTKEIKVHLKSGNIENNKYAFLCLRRQTLDKNTLNNKVAFVESLLKEDFVSEILNKMNVNFSDRKILYEGLWILINITYFTNDNNSDLTMFLSSKICIEFYMKICQLNDSFLNGSIYWLLDNLIEINNSYVRSRKVLFNIYMSPLCRNYLIDAIENKKNLIEANEEQLINILARMAEFVAETSTAIKCRKIEEFTDYNKNVNYDNLKDNNDYIFYHLFKLFISKIFIKNYVNPAVFALSKLTNYLDNSDICNTFISSGIFRKLIKEEILPEEDMLLSVIQIIGNYLSFVDESLIDKIIIDEVFSYFVKLINKYPSKQMLKRDIFWAASNLTVGTVSSCESFARSGLLSICLQSLYSDNEIVINESLFVLNGFFDIQNLEIIIKYYNLDYMKNICQCLKNWNNNHSGDCCDNENLNLIDKLVQCIGFLLEDGEICRQHSGINQFLNDFDKYGGTELLLQLISERKLNPQLSQDIENLFEMIKKNN